MNNGTSIKPVNFLRGVPADTVLETLKPMAAQGYLEAILKFGVDVLQYGHFTGFAPLRQYIGESHGVGAQRVIVGNGGLEVISLFFKSLPQGSTILVEETSYDRVLLDAVQYGHQLIGIALTPEGLDLDQLRQTVSRTSVAAFYGIPYHHNPTGITYTGENRLAVEKICRQNDILCFWDICYQPLRYDGIANDAIRLSDWGPIVASSFTKTIAPGTKCGYVILPEKFADHMAGVVANSRINPNLPTQAFIYDFITSGKYSEFLKYVCGVYAPRMQAFNDSMRSTFPETDPLTLTGGFFATLQLAGIGSDKEAQFIACAKEAGVGVASAWNAVAPNFRAQKKQQGMFIRLTFPAFTEEEIRFGIPRLKEAENACIPGK